MHLGWAAGTTALVGKRLHTSLIVASILFIALDAVLPTHAWFITNNKLLVVVF
jgi:hypothetical protein